MKSSILVNRKKVYFTDSGQGSPVVLLHGYLESLEIWDKFAKALAYHYRVISFDIPGHGSSETLDESHNMENLAHTIAQSLKLINVTKCFVVGHSMGGYVTLMMHKLFPELLSGFCLFHSHPFPDTEETKKKRLREIDFIKNGKKDLIAKFNIPNAFAKDNLNRFKQEVDAAIQIALNTPEKGIIANLHAMMNRPDMTPELEKSDKPFLYIIGKKDNYIEYLNIQNNVRLPQKSELHLLENSGHMGFIEEKEQSLKIISNFLNTSIHE